MSNWIPVTDKLPTDVLDMHDWKQVKVLVSTKQGLVKSCLFKWEKDYNGNYIGWKFTVYDVIAWMPLLEPYMEEK